MAIARDIDNATLAELQGVFYPVIFARIDWTGGPLRVHSNTGTITWNGQTWAGVGELGSVDVPPEMSGLVNDEFRVSLRGGIEEIFQALGSFEVGRSVRLWVGTTTEPGGTTLSGVPFFLAQGVTARPDLDQPGFDPVAPISDLPKLSIVASVGPSAMSSAEMVHTHESHSHAHPGDTIFQKVVHARAALRDPQTWPQS